MIVRQLGHNHVEVLASAKLNLFLEILGRRGDGYHDLESLMVSVNLFDHLEFFDDPSGQITLECDHPSLPTDASNLVIRAAAQLKAESGTDRGAKIVLRKSIPMQAGLAGGSSNAASTLVGLDRLWNLNHPKQTLEQLAATIGSDVAFFLNTPAAICRGRGELVEPLTIDRPLHFVLICPTVGVSTAEVYHRLIPPNNPGSIDTILEALKSGNSRALGQSLFNRLQPVAEAIEPSLVKVRKALEELGPLLDGLLMSGSGSTYFGLCRDEAAAGHAALILEPLGLGCAQVVTCRP